MKTRLITIILSATALITSIQNGLAQTDDKVAIKAVIERETQSWIKRDAKAMADCWADVPEAGHLYSVPDGKGTVVYSPDIEKAITTLAAGQQPSSDTFQNTDYQIRINGNGAFTQFDQAYSSADGTKNYSHQVRYLEKVSGTWKIVNVVSVYYIPTNEK